MAVQSLSQVIAAVEDYNDEIQDVDMEYDLDMMRDMRDLIASEARNLNPPTLPADPWPCD